MKKLPIPTVSWIFRPFLFLVLGVAVGYWIGFTDAGRGQGTLGARLALIKHKVDPAGGISEARQQNAERIREHVRAKSGIDSILPP